MYKRPIFLYNSGFDWPPVLALFLAQGEDETNLLHAEVRSPKRALGIGNDMAHNYQNFP